MVFKRSILSIIFFLLTAYVFGQKALTVAVAANAQFAMKEIEKNFEEETGINVDLIINSSGKISAQIKEGAPYDVFLSADMQFPEALYKEGLTIGRPEIYSYGSLVLWSLKILKNNNVKQLLLSSEFEMIAIANPKVAPYGEAAVEVLNYYKIYKETEPKLVFGESISQVNQYIVSGAVEIGFTAKSAVLSPETKGKGTFVELDKGTYKPIAQGVVLLKRSSDNKDAERFYKYIFSDKAKKVFKKYGYQLAK